MRSPRTVDTPFGCVVLFPPVVLRPAFILMLSAATMLLWMLLGAPSWRGRLSPRMFREWLFAGSAIVLGMALLAQHSALPDVVTIVAANGILAAGTFTVYRTAAGILGFALPVHGVRLALGGGFAGLVLIWWLDASPGAVAFSGARVMWMSASYVVAGSFVLGRLFRDVPRPWSLGVRCIAVAMALGCGAHLARVLSVAVLSDVSEPVLRSWVSVSVGASVMLQVQLYSVGMVFTLEARAQDDLRSKNERLRLDAATDALTGLANRRAFETAAAIEVGRAHRHGGALSVVFADVDHFKRINDRWGHVVGDAVLVELADICRQGLRGHDTVARWGGEEFALLLPHCSGTDASQVVCRLLARVRDTRIVALDGERVTMSVGIASLEPGEATLEAALQRADAALYRAKAGGRDQFVVDVVNAVVPVTAG